MEGVERIDGVSITDPTLDRGALEVGAARARARLAQYATAPAYEVVEIHASPDREVRRARTPRIYVDPQGESVMENFMGGRFTRPHQALKGMVEVIAKATFGESATVKWSQKAGCSCPCSPGFVVRGVPAVRWGTVTDLHVSFKVAEPYTRERRWTCIHCGKDKVRALMNAVAADNDPDPDLGWCNECAAIEAGESKEA